MMLLLRALDVIGVRCAVARDYNRCRERKQRRGEGAIASSLSRRMR
jgi:hypothetical protein